ncbi:MAG: sigma-70 family RNA polymerase sigma factor [Ilumatobacteraceae bacterium]
MPTRPANVRPVRSTCGSALEAVAADFTQLRPRLLGIAHRILGNRSEAEDIVQDAWVRWQTYDRSTVQSPTAFLVTTTTRLAINAAQSARRRRETCVDRWLHDPVDVRDDPQLDTEHRDDLDLGVVMLLERLSARERAVFVLRRAFDYEYAEIAAVVHLTEANVRQLVSRAGKRMGTGSRREVGVSEQRRLMHALVAAARHGHVAALESVLSARAHGESRERVCAA